MPGGALLGALYPSTHRLGHRVVGGPGAGCSGGQRMGAHALAPVFSRLHSAGLLPAVVRPFALAAVFWVFVLVGIHQILSIGCRGLEGFAGPISFVMLPTIIGALCWPLLVRVLHQLRGHYHLT